MNEFSVGGYRVDMSRSQIVANEHILSMEPKVLQVLLVLAKNQGQVVSHDRILNEVWPDVVVAPNALQRCIAQLRKAFGDDAKTQKFIATHPKVGYSLLADVDWHQALPEATTHNLDIISQGQLIKWRRLAIALAVLMLLLAILISALAPAPKPMTLSHLTALTATDDKEFHPAFSPDGRYIAFERFIAACQSHIWVKDLTQGNEYRLTQQPGVFGQLAWSPDGTRLAFSHVAQCTEERRLMGCSAIHGLSFTLAKATPQPTEQLLGCTDEHYGAVNWLDDDRLVYKATQDNSVQIRLLELTSHEQKTLLNREDFRPYALSFSRHLNKLVVTGFDAKQNPAMMMLRPDSADAATMLQINMQIPKSHQAITEWDPSWHPTEDYMLVSGGDTLFKVTENGHFIELPVPTKEVIYTPIFHPDGHRIAATMGTQDFDIALVHFIDGNSSSALAKVLHRSIVEDHQARFQPQGTMMSFVSKRSGREQLWLDKDGVTKQLTHFGETERLSSYIWSDDGRFVLAVVSGTLQVLHLDGQMQAIKMPFKVKQLYQHLGGNEVLLATVENHRNQLRVLNIASGQTRIVHDGFTLWAQLDDGGVLYFVDHLRKLKVKTPKAAAEPFMPAAELLQYSAFFIREQVLYLVGENGRLWLVDLSSHKVTEIVMAGLEDFYWEISDIAPDGRSMLVTKLHSARKEIVLFD